MKAAFPVIPALLLAGAMLIGCAKIEEPVHLEEPLPQNSGQVHSYTMTVTTGKGGGTRALGIDGHRGTIYFAPGMRVYGGTKPENVSLVPTVGLRSEYCYWRDYARIEPCTSHSGSPCTYCGHTD